MSKSNVTGGLLADLSFMDSFIIAGIVGFITYKLSGEVFWAVGVGAAILLLTQVMKPSA